jgi:hypothetical protein
MAITVKFQPPIHVAAIKELERSYYICNLEFRRTFKGEYNFWFYLTDQEICGIKTGIKFSKYKIEIRYDVKSPPKIYVLSPELVEKPKHVFPDKSLCLYHYSDFKWDDSKSIAYNLVPWIYLWVYYYEVWLQTGTWYGEEFLH